MNPPPSPAPRKDKPNKRRAALLKLIGTAMVLLALATQYLFYDRWKDAADSTARLVSRASSSRQNLDRARAFGYFRKGRDDVAQLGKSDLFSDYLLSFAELCEHLSCRGMSDPAFPFSFQGQFQRDTTIVKPHEIDAFLAQSISTERYVLELAERSRASASSTQTSLRALFISLYFLGSFALLGGLVFEVRGASE